MTASIYSNTTIGLGDECLQGSTRIWLNTRRLLSEYTKIKGTTHNMLVDTVSYFCKSQRHSKHISADPNSAKPTTEHIQSGKIKLQPPQLGQLTAIILLITARQLWSLLL
jgi:hypothetical protein